MTAAERITEKLCGARLPHLLRPDIGRGGAKAGFERTIEIRDIGKACGDGNKGAWGYQRRRSQAAGKASALARLRQRLGPSHGGRVGEMGNNFGRKQPH